MEPHSHITHNRMKHIGFLCDPDNYLDYVPMWFK